MRSICITGVSGMLGNNLAMAMSRENRVIGIYHQHPVAVAGTETFGLDLLDYAALREFLLEKRPEVIIHCASRTKVDAQQENPEDAWRANVQATRNLLDACRDLPSKLVHISTDAVYADRAGPHSEKSPLAPVNVYGVTKLEAEQLVSSRSGSLILRTNIYGWNIQPKQSLSEWAYYNLRNSRFIHGFQDVLFSGIYTSLLAGIIEKCLAADLSGTFNCASRDAWSKYEFAARMAQHLGCTPALVLPSTLAEAGLTAPRGKDLRLDVKQLECALGQRLPLMQDSLEAFLADAAKGLPERILVGNTGGIGAFYPKRSIIPYGGQCIDAADLDAMSRVLRGNNLTQGPTVEEFEKAISRQVEADYAIAVSSGTAGLHIACLAAGLGPGDEFVTTPITFVASANCGIYCGAKPIFADIDQRTYNISLDSLRAVITPATRVVIPVHFAGQCCDMRSIHEVVRFKEREYGTRITIIEDACHAFGSKYLGQPIGNCRYSDMTVFSFHPVKHITTAEGGLVTTQDPELSRLLAMLRSHGIERDSSRLTQHPGPWYYEQVALGYHYRITDMQCALGLSQLHKLPWFMARRRSIVNRYNSAFADVPFLTVPWEAEENDSNFHLYVVLFDFVSLGCNRAELMLRLRDKRIQTQVHYIPVPLQPYYRRTYGYGPGSFPRAEAYYDRCLSLPLHPGMSDADVEHVIATVRALA